MYHPLTPRTHGWTKMDQLNILITSSTWITHHPNPASFIMGNLSHQDSPYLRPHYHGPPRTPIHQSTIHKKIILHTNKSHSHLHSKKFHHPFKFTHSLHSNKFHTFPHHLNTLPPHPSIQTKSFSNKAVKHQTEQR